MNHLKKVVAFFLAAVPSVASAACTGGGGLCNPLGYDSLTTFLANILKIVAQIGFPVVVLFLVYIGFLYVSSASKPEKLAKVHGYFFWAVVGGLVVLGAEALSLAIQATVQQIQQGA